MFYYRITETRRYRKRGGAERQVTRRTHLREYLRERDLGEFVAHLVGSGASRVTVEPLKQAAYQRAVER